MQDVQREWFEDLEAKMARLRNVNADWGRRGAEQALPTAALYPRPSGTGEYDAFIRESSHLSDDIFRQVEAFRASGKPHGEWVDKKRDELMTSLQDLLRRLSNLESQLHPRPDPWGGSNQPSGYTAESLRNEIQEVQKHIEDNQTLLSLL